MYCYLRWNTTQLLCDWNYNNENMTGRGRSRGRSTDPYPLKKHNSTHDGSERPRQLPLAVNAMPSSSQGFGESMRSGRLHADPQQPPFDLLFSSCYNGPQQHPANFVQSTANANIGSTISAPFVWKAENVVKMEDAVKSEIAVKMEIAVEMEAAVEMETAVEMGTAVKMETTNYKEMELTDIVRTKPQNVQSKKGTSGRPVTLLTNHFRVLEQPGWQLYQYSVDFTPPVELRGLRNRLIFEQKRLLGGYLFDGTLLYLSFKLPNGVTQCLSRDHRGYPIRTTIKFITPVDMTKTVSAHILNLILRRSMGALKLQLIGRNFFDAIAKINIPQYHLQLWPGYVTSIRQHETDIMLSAEITNKVMRTETLYDILMSCVQNERMNYQNAFKSAVLGMTVLTAYNNMTYYIDDVDFNASPRDTFSTHYGDITFMDYYRDKYQLTIRNDSQPLLAARFNGRVRKTRQFKNVFLVPELCRATGLGNMRSDYRLMSTIETYTRLAPKVRIERLNAFNQRLRSTDESVKNFKEWNLMLDMDMVQVNGRQLPNERLLFGDKKIELTNHETDWSREFRNVSMFTSQHLRNWVVIVPQCKHREAEDFIDILQRAGIGMRYDIARPTIISIPDDRCQAYSGALDQAFCRDPQLIMCIVQNNNADKYSLIKKKCCVERAVPSQVMVANRITPKKGRDRGSQLSVATKVAVQINSKLGGVPWMVEIPTSGLMVVGVNVCRDAQNNRMFYGALVASMDMKCAQNYFSAVTPYANGEELCNQLTLNMGRALICFVERHNSFPNRIVLYRAGVREDRINHVYEHEMKQIRDRLENLYGDGARQLKFTFIIVSKHSTTRFFRGNTNPDPGTVVDDVVTLPERYDFFLNSQFLRHGTVSPTNYNVLHDTSGFSPDRLQILSYKMTHLYYNWSGTLAVPAVCQYAHKLAYLVGNFIHQPPSNLLEKQLYFL